MNEPASARAFFASARLPQFLTKSAATSINSTKRSSAGGATFFDSAARLAILISRMLIKKVLFQYSESPPTVASESGQIQHPHWPRGRGGWQFQLGRYLHRGPRIA